MSRVVRALFTLARASGFAVGVVGRVLFEAGPYLLLFLLIVAGARPWFMIGAVSASWCSGFAVGFLEGLWKRWKDRR